VAVARAADAAQRVVADVPGERELEAAVVQGGGLPRAGRTDDEVPRQLVQVAAAQARPPGRGEASGAEAGAAQRLQRLLEPRLDGRQVGAGGFVAIDRRGGQ